MRIAPILTISLVLFAAAPAARAQEAEVLFKKICSACHTIGGGRLVGPDLLGVGDRKDREWLIRFMVDPTGVLDSDDPYAKKILDESFGVRMAPIPELDAEMAGLMLDFLAGASGDASAAPPPEDNEPYTSKEIRTGRDYFLGTLRLENGGPSCNSCHATAGAGTWGGRLGPDLTQAFTRYGGRRGLRAWLTAPQSAVMSPVFTAAPLTDDEIDDLIGFFEAEADSGVETAPPVRAAFLLSGVVAAAALLALFGFFWKNRYRATRKPLIARTKR